MHFMNAISPVVYWDSRVGARVGAARGFPTTKLQVFLQLGTRRRFACPGCDAGQRFRPEVSAGGFGQKQTVAGNGCVVSLHRCPIPRGEGLNGFFKRVLSKLAPPAPNSRGFIKIV